MDEGGYFSEVEGVGMAVVRAAAERLCALGVDVLTCHHEAGPGQYEVDLEDAAWSELGRHEIDHASVRRANCGYAHLVGPERAVEARALQGRRPVQRPNRVVGIQADCADGRPTLEKVGTREGVRIGVQNKIDIALAVKRHFLGTMLACVPETELLEQCAQGAPGCIVDGELEERDPAERWDGRRIEQLDTIDHARADLRIVAAVTCPALEARSNLPLDVEQRPHRIGRGSPVRNLPEQIIENLQRKRSRITGEQDLFEEVLDIELALTGKVAVVTRPLQHIHDQERRVGELHEENLLSWNLGDTSRIVAQRQGVKAVDDQPEMRMVGALDDSPSLRIQLHCPAPSKRLKTYAQVAPRGALRKLVELRRHALFVRDELWRCVRAHEHDRRAERLHDVELSLRAIEVLAKDGIGRALEVPEGLVKLAA